MKNSIPQRKKVCPTVSAAMPASDPSGSPSEGNSFLGIGAAKRYVELFLSFLSGADKGDILRVFASFFALFFLLSSYYLIKPLRMPLYLREFSADSLPLFHIGVIVSSFILTAIFNFFYNRYSQRQIVVRVYLVTALTHLCFAFFLGFESKWIVLCFCLWSSVYFLLCIALLWGSFNYFFTMEKGKQVYGFVWIGAITGSMSGILVTKTFLNVQDWRISLFVCGFLTLVSLSFLLVAERCGENRLCTKEEKSKTKKEEEGFFSKLKEFRSRPYLSAVAILVFALTFCRSTFDYQTAKILDFEFSTRIYDRVFVQINKNFNAHQGLNQSRNEDLFGFIHHLKLSSAGERESRIFRFLRDRGMHINSEEFYSLWKEWSLNVQIELSKFQANIAWNQNIAGIILLIFCKGFLFRFFGIKTVILILPVTYLFVSLHLFFPMDINMVEFLKIFSGAVDYSLNNAAKEILYTPLDAEANLRFKPFIEGPVFKMGSASAAMTKIGVDTIFSSSLAAGANILVLLALLMVFLWIRCSFFVISQCQKFDRESDAFLLR